MWYSDLKMPTFWLTRITSLTTGPMAALNVLSTVKGNFQLEALPFFDKIGHLGGKGTQLWGEGCQLAPHPINLKIFPLGAVIWKKKSL